MSESESTVVHIDAPITDVILRLYELKNPAVEWQRDDKPFSEQIDRTRTIDPDEVVNFRMRWTFFAVLFTIVIAQIEGTFQTGDESGTTRMTLAPIKYPPTILIVSSVLIIIALFTTLLAVVNGDFVNVILGGVPMLVLAVATYSIRSSNQSLAQTRIQQLQQMGQ